jgi:hypothetical protein
LGVGYRNLQGEFSFGSYRFSIALLCLHIEFNQRFFKERAGIQMKVIDTNTCNFNINILFRVVHICGNAGNCLFP